MIFGYKALIQINAIERSLYDPSLLLLSTVEFELYQSMLLKQSRKISYFSPVPRPSLRILDLEKNLPSQTTVLVFQPAQGSLTPKCWILFDIKIDFKSKFQYVWSHCTVPSSYERCKIFCNNVLNNYVG